MRRAIQKVVVWVCIIAMFFCMQGVQNMSAHTQIFAADSKSIVIKATEDNVLTLGKTFMRNGSISFSYANSGVEINFKGSSVAADFTVGQDSSNPQEIAVFVDDNIEPEDAKIITLTGDGEYTLAEGLEYGKHTVTIRKMYRSYYGFLAVTTVSLNNIILESNGELLAKSPDKDITIEVFGDSITNGDALYLKDDGTSSSYSWMGYAGEVARYFDADLKSCGISGQGLLRSILAGDDGIFFNLYPPASNWAVMDESAGTEGQVAYDHNANPADAVIINLGTNDNAAFGSGQITADEFKTEYLRFINEIHTDCPDAIVVGALGAMGADGLIDAINNAVSEANTQAGYTYAYFTELENCNNITNGLGYDNSHPSQVAHKIYGQQISAILEKAFLANGVLDEADYQEAKVVNTRHSSYEDTDRVSQYAVDDDANTRWAGVFHSDAAEWIELEFDQIYEVNKINLEWEAAFAEKYSISTSLDGVNWTEDTAVNNGNGYTETKRLAGTKAKYLRVNMLQRGTFFNYSLYEIDVYGKPIKVEEEKKAKTVVGEMFMPSSVSPSSADCLIDNSGMSGLEAPNHMHASFDSSDSTSNGMIADNMYSGDKTSIVIDLGKKESIGEMYIWNYNDIQHLDYGMKNVIVDYSEDGSIYTHLGVYTLDQCNNYDNNVHGGNVSVEVNGERSVNFKGITGRYVRITPIDNYGGDKYGLSEVRIFRHKTEPVSGDCLTVDAFAPNQLDNTTVNNAFNNSGFSKIDDDADDASTHSNNKDDMAVLSGDSNTSMIVLNLDGNYPLNSIKLWNYNEPGNTGIGINSFDLYYTTGSPCNIVTHSTEEINAGASDYIDFNQGDWKKLGTYTLPEGTGKADLEEQLYIDMQGIRAQHIKIVPINNHNGGISTFGLSEVKVYITKGWATEYSREWTGLMSSSGEFKYQGNSVADNKGSSLLNSNNGRGWIGGDGVHTTGLNGNQLSGSVNQNSKTIFTFQDSFEGNFGNYDGFGWEHGYGTADNCGFSIGMRNHAYMMLDGDEPDVRNIKSYMQLENGMSEADGYGGNIYPGKYWLGDSTVINNTMYTIANRFEGLTVPDADLFASPLTNNGFPSMTAIPTLLSTNITENTEADYHETIYEDGEYLYLYGKKDNQLVVSRIKAENYSSLTGFTYWNGSDWVSDSNQIAAISSFMPGNEFNITKMNSGTFAGKYVLIHTDFSITGSISYAVSDSLTGPFMTPADSQIYFSTEKYKLHMRYYSGKPVIFQQWNYNAKSQPALSQEGELLITYHFGIHDDQENRVPGWGYFSAVGKEYEHPTFIKMFDIEDNAVIAEASDKNLALEKNITASGIESDDRAATMANDGNMDTRWAAPGVDPTWILIDLGKNKDICKVILEWETAYAKEYKLQVSNDREVWKTVYEETNGDGGNDTIEFATVNARYVRMYGTKRGTIHGYSLYEFEVYGPVGASEEDTTPDATIEGGIEINGFQISTTVEGTRTVYSVEPEINDKTVTEVGLIYGLKDNICDEQMVADSSSSYVKSYAGTKKNGLLETSFSESKTASTYVMTMRFSSFTENEFDITYSVRAYAKLEDGSYAYTDVVDYSVFTVAKTLYNNVKMPSAEQHDYLYNKILTIVEPEYKTVDYDWSNVIVPIN